MNLIPVYVAALIISFMITINLIPKILFVSIKKKMLDIPDSRKIHTCTSSRLGGVAFFPSLFITMCIVIPMVHFITGNTLELSSYWLMLSLGASFLMYIVGISDDIKGVSYRIKFMYQIFASVIIIVSGTWINNLYGIFGIYEIPMWIGFPLTSLFIVFIINAINLIDGIDGLSSGLSVVAFSFYGLIFLINDKIAPAMISFAAVGTLLGFFRYNFFGFPNRLIKIFMGDSGTLFIGTTISHLALKLLYYDTDADNIYKSNTEILIAYSVLIVPCFDVIRVMLHRLKNKKHLFSPDKKHIHHKILALEFTTKQTLFIILSFSVLITLTNLLLYQVVALEYVMIFDVAIWTLLNVILTKKIHS